MHHEVNEFQIVMVSADDYVGLYYGDSLIGSGHSIPSSTWMEIVDIVLKDIAARAGDGFEYVDGMELSWEDHDWVNDMWETLGHPPETLTELYEFRDNSD